MFNKTEIYEAVIGINPGYYQKGKEVNGYIFNFDAISQICQNIFNSNHIKVISGIIEKYKSHAEEILYSKKEKFSENNGIIMDGLMEDYYEKIQFLGL